MRIPILNGISADAQRADLRVAYPRNMVPVLLTNGISEGYLRPAEGIAPLNVACPGNDRGAVAWRGLAYRIMGTKLCAITPDGALTVLGDVGGSGYVSMDYSFDRLGFASGGQLWYSINGAAPVPVVDPDAGTVLDAIFLAGYWMFTDGSFIAVTDLADSFAVNPLRYGSSEVDPDPIVALKRIRDEAYAINRHTIEAFRNVGGTGFPFQVIPGSQVMRGAVGRAAVCVFNSSLAFVGSGRGEGISVFLSTNGDSVSIASREVEQVLERYDEATLANIVLESRFVRGHKFLYMHLPDKTYVYDAAASIAVDEPVWHILASGARADEQYRARSPVLVGTRWIVGDPAEPRVGYLTEDVASSWGQKVGWEFSVPALYNDGNPAIIHELELVALTGRAELGVDPVVWTSSSPDGVVWTAERHIPAGKRGDRQARLVWLGQGPVQNWRTQRFRGSSDANLSFARLEARIEPLNRKRANAS